jgi:hypothetical protein
MESWLITNGADISQGEDGNYGVSVPSGTMVDGTSFSLFSGAGIQTNDSFAPYVSDKTNVWDGTAGGPGKGAAINDIGNRIAANISLTGGTSDLFSVGSIDASGDPATRQGGSQLTVKNDLAALRELGIGTAEFNALMSQPVGERIRAIVGTQLFRRQEGVENRAMLGQPIDQAKLDDLRYRGAQAAADYERAVSAPPAPNPFSTGLGAIPSFAAKTPKGPREKALGELTKQRAAKEFDRMASQASSDYFFRYSQMSSAPDANPAGSPTSSYTGSMLGSAPSFRPPTVRPTFTPAQVEKSMVDFRAGERAPLGISSSTATSR